MVCEFLCIYIYRERERERKIEMHTHVNILKFANTSHVREMNKYVCPINVSTKEYASPLLVYLKMFGRDLNIKLWVHFVELWKGGFGIRLFLCSCVYT